MYLFRAPRSGLIGLLESFFAAGDESPSFPHDVWRRRHIALVSILVAHALTIFAVSIINGYGVEHGLLEALVPAFSAGMAMFVSRARAEAAGWAALGLLASFIILLHLVEGALWMNLHFALLLLLLSAYRSWTTILAALATLLIEHVVLAFTDPHSVYGHEGQALAPIIASAQLLVVGILGVRIATLARNNVGRQDAQTNAAP